jgi:hypothetical protein
MLLIVFGAIVLVIGGVSYVKNRDKVDLGVAKITTEERGFIPPWVGAVALVGGIVLVLSGRRRGDVV